MSTQKGNVQKKGAPRHQNIKAFQNDRNDTSKKLKEINSMEFHGLCGRCKDCLDWKVKFKKYKPLTIPKKCVKCFEKKVKVAYYTTCQDCCLKFKICSKCSKPCEEVTFGETELERLRKEQNFQFELKQLSERKRRKFLRLLEKGVLTKENLTDVDNKANMDDYEDEDVDGDFDEEDDEDFDDLDEQMRACELNEKRKREKEVKKSNSKNQEDADDEEEDDDDNYVDMSDEDYEEELDDLEEQIRACEEMEKKQKQNSKKIKSMEE